jgi:diaminohydroxyphosphoribosylaminopyrimidine deaminase/5-amino-6-(5-phosphoribosylamino)uracil reductase
VYVNLEPCAHHGKTPPCVDALIEAGVARVVIGMRDPNPLVAGKGIRKLRAAGMDVAVGVLEEEARVLNRAFIMHVTTGTPFVTVKLAVSSDGRIAAGRGRRTALSGEKSNKRVHAMRAECDAVLIGRGTLDVDRPRLTVREVKGRNPLRVVVDTRLSGRYRASFTREVAPTVIFSNIAAAKGERAAKLRRKGIRVVGVPMRGRLVSLRAVVRILGRMGIASLLVEGGSEIASSFLRQQLVSELILIVAPKELPGGIPAVSNVDLSPFMKHAEVELVGKDVWMRLNSQ